MGLDGHIEVAGSHGKFPLAVPVERAEGRIAL